MPKVGEISAHVGVCVLIVVLAEIAQHSTLVSTLILACSTGLYLPHILELGLANVKYILVYAVCAVWLFRERLDPDGSLFMRLALANVLVMALPLAYELDIPLLFSVLALAWVTPRTYTLLHLDYLRAYAAVFGTYFIFGDPFAANPLGALMSVLPMFVGIATQSVTRTIAIRVLGMLVVASIDFIRPMFGVSNVPPATLFRPIHGQPHFTTLSDMLKGATDRTTHRAPIAIAMLLNTVALAPLLSKGW